MEMEEKEELKGIIFELVMTGFTVTKHDNRFRGVKQIDKTKTVKLEVIDHWSDDKGWHIGEVTSFGANGNWVHTPMPADEYFYNKIDKNLAK